MIVEPTWVLAGGSEALLFLALTAVSTVVQIASQPDTYVPTAPNDDSAERQAAATQDRLRRMKDADNERFTRNEGTLGSQPVGQGLGMPTLISSHSQQGSASATSGSNSSSASASPQ